MKNNVFSRYLAAGLALFMLPGFAPALEVDVYGGFGAGYAVQRQTTGDKTTDSAGKVYVGSRFLGPLGVEISYYNLGLYNNGTDKIKGASAAAVANLDIRGMTLFAKGGVVRWTKTDVTNGADVSGEDVSYGFGINLPVDKHVLVRTEIERFRKVGKDAANGDPGKDMSMLSFGLNFRF